MKFGYDTIIVGGGVIGVSIAYFLTKSGQRVAVLERNTLASGSSGKCDGDVQNVDSKPVGHRLFRREHGDVSRRGPGSGLRCEIRGERQPLRL